MKNLNIFKHLFLTVLASYTIFTPAAFKFFYCTQQKTLLVTKLIAKRKTQCICFNLNLAALLINLSIAKSLSYIK